ncbi:high mobility group, HMG1/HMG2 domain containing protein [Rhodotorula toruloides]|uniref:High mobility group, HMG1/HMG2 domain containing protein n=1 Tax=Rhodotorula toruloides TaxID=5286 RepID=A0A511KNK8_RHOTO|nr:high mobility group, HMG1/HMG2 domain containing protein [Rhodotorula toruloides]
MALARTLAHSHIRTLQLAHTARPALVSLRPVASSSPAVRALFSTSPRAHLPPKDTTNLAESAGSRQASRADKDRAQRERERKRAERQAAEAQRAKARKEREETRKAKAKAKKEREQERKHKEAERKKEQREKARAKAEREKEKALQARNKLRSNLSPPKRITNKWQIFVSSFVQERRRSLPAGTKMPTIPTLVPEAKAAYAQLSSSELAALDQRVEQARADYERQLAEWQKTLTPEMIREENLVRSRRRRAGLSRKANLHVPGEPKRPITPFFRFSAEVRERQDRDVLGDETNVTEQSKLLARAWKALSPEQKKSYEDAYKVENEQYKAAKAKFDAQMTASA